MVTGKRDGRGWVPGGMSIDIKDTSGYTVTRLRSLNSKFARTLMVVAITRPFPLCPNPLYCW